MPRPVHFGLALFYHASPHPAPLLSLAACVAASTVISLIFAYFQRFGVRNLPAIVVNYFVCVACGVVFEGGLPLGAATLGEPWLPLALVLGFFFIGGFNLNALCVQRAGVAVTSVVQRISLLLSVGFAVLYYDEPLGWRQGIGVLLGVAAVVLTVRFERSAAQGSRRGVWVLPLAVFLVAGAIESLLTVAQRSFGAGGDVSFTVGLFLWAGTLGLVYAVVRPPADGSPRLRWRDVVGGIALGIPNFFSIHLILVALDGGLDASTVFPVLNVSTIVLSALLALLLFGQRLSPKQWAGVAVAAVAIALLVG